MSIAEGLHLLQSKSSTLLCLRRESFVLNRELAEIARLVYVSIYASHSCSLEVWR